MAAHFWMATTKIAHEKLSHSACGFEHAYNRIFHEIGVLELGDASKYWSDRLMLLSFSGSDESA